MLRGSLYRRTAEGVQTLEHCGQPHLQRGDEEGVSLQGEYGRLRVGQGQMAVYAESQFPYGGKEMEYGLLPVADCLQRQHQAYWLEDEEKQEHLQGFVRKERETVCHRVEEGDDIRDIREVSECI